MAGLTQGNQAMVNRVESQFEPVGDAQLVKDGVEVIFYRLFLHGKLAGNFAVCPTADDASQNVEFAWRKGFAGSETGIAGAFASAPTCAFDSNGACPFTTRRRLRSMEATLTVFKSTPSAKLPSRRSVAEPPSRTIFIWDELDAAAGLPTRVCFPRRCFRAAPDGAAAFESVPPQDPRQPLRLPPGSPLHREKLFQACAEKCLRVDDEDFLRGLRCTTDSSHPFPGKLAMYFSAQRH